MAEEIDDDGGEFALEPLFANGVRVYTMDNAVVMARLPYGKDNGFTEAQARHWAAHMAKVPEMVALLQELAVGLDCGFDSPVTRKAISILASCVPKAKGMPFKRDPSPKADWERAAL